ncbi:hypothetical protein H6S82_08085 [Planktothrix sp. FACHB-1355]|uniref:Uncharacterized protein n=1 Tax=Aerosakkonema funiforme FACHB-1375 TaxID=2949571 RepID=A0A926VCJ0_9CYAN|nr:MULTISPECIES: hypothetical protein [Oscillatoriales]MBD2181271.1 hypothetical protein [Aerosakkonema funiforme FACHB-1375]MBD3558814.1 hypothetical protein [Planktothrix sp. FACHB-1355]
MVQSQELEVLHPKLLADVEGLRGQKERLTLSAMAERGNLVEGQLYTTNVQEVAKTLQSVSKPRGD